MSPPHNMKSYLICRGPNAHYLFHLLAHFKRGDCDGIKVRLGRLQEFIQTACIEHLDFLSIDPDLARGFQPFQEKDMGKQFQSLTDIPKVALTSHTDTWLDYKVGGMGWWERDTFCQSSNIRSREWRCSWSSADRRCSNYIWMINSFIAH